MMRLRQQVRAGDWFSDRVVTPARAMRAMSRMMTRLVLLARFVLVAPANTATMRAIVRAREMVIDWSPLGYFNFYMRG